MNTQAVHTHTHTQTAKRQEEEYKCVHTDDWRDRGGCELFRLLCDPVSLTLSSGREGSTGSSWGGERAQIHVSLCRESKIGSFLDGGAPWQTFNWSICLPSSFSPSLLVQLCCDLGLNTNQLSSLMDSEYNKKKERNDWPSTPYNFYLGFDRPHWNRSTLCYSIE
jgi:hypothetical protein